MGQGIIESISGKKVKLVDDDKVYIIDNKEGHVLTQTDTDGKQHDTPCFLADLKPDDTVIMTEVVGESGQPDKIVAIKATRKPETKGKKAPVTAERVSRTSQAEAQEEEDSHHFGSAPVSHPSTPGHSQPSSTPGHTPQGTPGHSTTGHSGTGRKGH